jgi:hypothetical protein
MTEQMVVERVQRDEDGSLSKVYYNPNNGKLVSNPQGNLIVREDAIKSGKVDPRKPTAIPKKVIDETTGTVEDIYVDAKTGRRIENTEGYNILDPTFSNVNQFIQQVTAGQQEAIESGHKNGDSSRQDMGPKPAERTATNNFGYTEKPGALKLAGFVPGPIGTMAKVAGVAMNVGNNAAAKKAGDYLGFTPDESGLFGKVGDVLGDQKGYIGDINYNGVTTAVGLGAEDKKGRTTLTPDEARMRQALSGATQATNQQTEDNIQNFKDTKPPTSLVGKALDRIGKATGLVKEDAPVKTSPINVNNEPEAMQTQYNPTGSTFAQVDARNPFSNVNDPDLPEREMASLGYSLGPNRPNVPQGGIGQKVQDVVTDVLGPGFGVTMISGQGEYGSKRHRDHKGVAGDFSITDQLGNPISQDQMKTVSQGFAAKALLLGMQETLGMVLSTWARMSTLILSILLERRGWILSGEPLVINGLI